MWSLRALDGSPQKSGLARQDPSGYFWVRPVLKILGRPLKNKEAQPRPGLTLLIILVFALSTSSNLV